MGLAPLPSFTAPVRACSLMSSFIFVYVLVFLGVHRKEKTLLLFVIRDHVGATPLANLANTLRADLERIWHGLSKV